MLRHFRHARKSSVWEALETRRLLAAHIVGSSTVYSTIQAAVNAASVGSTITVDAGTYTELVTVNKKLTLRGAQGGVDARSSSRGASGTESIVTGVSGSSGVSESFYITANDVTLDGFTVQGETSQSVSTGAGIVIGPSVSGTRILDNIVQNNVAGMYLANNSATDPAVIQHNVFQSNNNPGTNGGRGIYTDGPISGGNLTNVIIDANTFSNNRGTTGTTSAEAGCAFEATTLGEQSNISITNNLFQINGKAVLFFDTNNILIQGNTIVGQFDGSGTIRFEGGDTNVTITNNNCYNNDGTGVAIDSKAVGSGNSGFTVQQNNFVNNSDAWGDKLSVIVNAGTYTGTLNANSNWWNSASGPGGQGPGTGDTVYGDGHWVDGHQWAEVVGSDVTFANWVTTPFTWTVPTAPVSLTGSATVNGSTATVALSWPSVSGTYRYSLQRSTDNVNFTTIAAPASSATSYSDVTTAGTIYYYRIAAENTAGASVFTNSSAISTGTTTTPTPPPAPTGTGTYISDLTWVSATTGYGTIQKDKSINGNALKLNGVTYAKGIGTHAVSNIVYNLAGQYTTFTSDVGVDDEENGKGTGSVDFQVIGDGKVLFDSGILHNGGPTGHVNISVVGVKQLTLAATNGVSGSIDYDHSDWAGAELFASAPVAPTAPSGLSAAALSASAISLSWTPTSSNQTSYAIDRSSDGTNFTTIATGVIASATTYTDSGPLSANAKYYYRIRAVNSVNSSPNSNVASATTQALTTVTTYVSDLTATSATVGYGTIQKDKSILGNPLTLKGVVYAKGIGTHALSSITYNIAGKYKNFFSEVGIDQEEDGKGTGHVDFQVVGDGKVLFDSGVLTNDQADAVNVNVTGIQTLTLIATNGVANNIDYDHADWAGADLTA